MTLNIFLFVFVAILVFFLGIFGIILNRRSVILVLLCIELILLSINLNFIFFSSYLDDFIGQLFALNVLTVAAAESAIGLAILVLYFRVQNNLNMNNLNLLHG
jgi:NADH-quinone oxidoreductase subunit K